MLYKSDQNLYNATAGASGGSVKSGIEALGVPATHVAVLTPQAACATWYPQVSQFYDQTDCIYSCRMFCVFHV